MDGPEPLRWDTSSDLKVNLLGQPTLVQAAEVVEANQGSVWLSNLDQGGCRAATETVYLFKARASARDPAEAAAGTCGQPAQHSVGHSCHMLADADDNPAAVLRDALARALVLFYPFTGRLAPASDGRYEIRLTGEGVLFVEAEANLELAQLGYSRGLAPPRAVAKQLVVTVATPLQGPLMAAQVTRFQCGGWALGIAMNHGVVDGSSGVKFMQVWAKLARLPSTTSLTDFPPFALDRTCLRQRSPLQVTFDHARSYDTVEQTRNAEHGDSQGFMYRLKAEQLKALKQKVLQEQGCRELERITTFEALAALLWRARTRALGIADQEQTELRVLANVSKRLEPALPEGYMGNTVTKGVCVATAGHLCSRPLSYGVALIQEAMAGLTHQHIRSFIDYIGHLHPQLLPSAGAPASCLILNSWTRLGFQLVDFGWGEPVSSGPSDTDILVLDQECRAFLLPLHGDDCRMDMKMIIGLPPSTVTKFEEEMRQWLSGT